MISPKRKGYSCGKKDEPWGLRKKTTSIIGSAVTFLTLVIVTFEKIVVTNDSRSISSTFVKTSPFHLGWVFQFRRAFGFLFSNLIGKISKQMSGQSESEESWSSDFSSESDYASWGSSSEGTPANRSLFFESKSEATVLNIGNVHFAWCAEYAMDILRYLREQEAKRKRIMFKSPQKHLRFALVELIKSVAESQHLNRTTVHLAVYLLDVFMDVFKIVPNKLSLVALTCVLLAAKMEERDRNIPRMHRLSSLANGQYTKHEFKIVEIKILSTLNWSLLCPTAATYVECYACGVVSVEDFNNLSTGGSFTPPRIHFKSYNHLVTTANGLIFEFLDLALQEPRIMHLEPSALAAACLAAARKLCGLLPLWPKSLRALTGYEIDALAEFIGTLISFRENHRPNRKDTTPDSGFLSESNSESEEEAQPTLPLPFKRRKFED